MGSPIKAQPLYQPNVDVPGRNEVVNLKYRFRRPFDRQFSAALRSSILQEKPLANYIHCEKDELEEIDPSNVCFIAKDSDRPTKTGWKRCNCFNVNGSYSSDDDEFDLFGRSGKSKSNHHCASDACESLKQSLVPCACVLERNLLADIAKIVNENNIKRKDNSSKHTVVNGLIALGYDASVCKSKWEKSNSCPSGEYEYMDVIIEGKRLIIDVDFRSEFEIARSTKAYRFVLQMLPVIFVSKEARLEKIIDIVSEAAKQSLKKKGLYFPPWRKAEYIKSKWLSPPIRSNNLPLISLVKTFLKINSKIEKKLIKYSETANVGGNDSWEDEKILVNIKQGNDAAGRGGDKIVVGAEAKGTTGGKR